MRYILWVLCTLFSFSALASTEAFDMKMDLSIDGHHVSSPKVIALPNEKASITQKNDQTKEETFIEVTASDVSNEHVKNGILMKFVVGYNRDGKRQISSRPEIIARAGEEALIEVGNPDGTMKLKVIANRIQK